MQFLHLTEDDRTAISDLSTIVGQDPSLAARILTVANSPALCRGAQCRDLTQCLITLGTRLSRTLAACLVIQNVFSPSAGKRHYNLTGFWGHSLRVAESARAIAEETGYGDSEEVYIAGLLHDVGELLLLGGMEKHYAALLAMSNDENELRDAELRVLHTDHAMVSAWLVDQWKLSSFMADAVLFHHSPPDAIITADNLSKIIWAAHLLCETSISPETGEPEQTADLDTIISLVGLAPEKLSTLRHHCSERVAQLAEALGISEHETRKSIPTATTPLETSRREQKNTAQDNTLLEESARAMALIYPLQQDLISLESESELLLAVRESARILFGMGRVAFLLVQPDGKQLSGAPDDGQLAMLQQLQIPLDPAQSLAAASLRNQHPYSTFSRDLPAPISLADVQISRILGSEGLLYFPLNSKGKEIGVMVNGIGAAHSNLIQERLPWVTSFIQVAADTLGAWRDMRSREQQRETDLARRFEQRGRRAAHEAGNPLAIIKNYLSIIKNKIAEQPDIVHEMDILKEEIDRIGAIIRHMSHASDEPPSTAPLDINALIESMLALYGDTLFSQRGIAVEKSLDPAMQPICVERDSLKQILTNLWNNAADAMGTGDCFFISTHAVVNQNGHPYVEISMNDTGPGLPPDVMERLFQPLEPDRRPGHGGVGLSIVAGLVERLHGRITCQSRKECGTTFSILLPHPGRSEG